MNKLPEVWPMTFRPELIDELLKDYRNPEDLMGEGGIFKQLSKALIERNQKSPEIDATVIARRPLKENLVHLRLLSPVTATEPLNLN
jgi:hypothetical protein